jgi:molecular chaperone GrpE
VKKKLLALPLPCLNSKQITSMNDQEETVEKKENLEAKVEETTDQASEDNNDSAEENSEKEEVEQVDYQDKYLRLYAEFDNFRKRTMRERVDLIMTASQDLIEKFLPLLDDFERI